MKKWIVSLVLILVVILFMSCSKEVKDNRSMEQIYKEEGVPVRTKQIALEDFLVEKAYNAVLTGIEESLAFAKVEDKVERVYMKVGDYVATYDYIDAYYDWQLATGKVLSPPFQ